MPDHLKLSAYSLPRQLNEFLLSLHRLPRLHLCPLLPLPLVKPEVRPAALDREGGPLLRAKIEKLTQASLVLPQEHKLEMRQTACEMTGGRGEEQTALLPPAAAEGQTLVLELEPGLPSTRQMEDRERLETEE